MDTERPFGEDVIDLLFRLRGALEEEVSFLLGSEQIRDQSPYNAVLSAIAGGATQFYEILSLSGTERASLSFYLRTLIYLMTPETCPGDAFAANNGSGAMVDSGRSDRT